MRFILYIVLLLTAPAAFAQQKLFRFVEKGTGKPVSDADVYTDTVFVAATNYNGNVKVDINGNYKRLSISHVNYEKRLIPRDSLAVQKVYQLKKLAHVLDEVVLDSEQRDTLFTERTDFNWGDRAATFIKYEDDKIIKKIRFKVNSVYGVKGLEYLPFYANFYAYDTISLLPGKPLLAEDIFIENTEGNKWAEADISSYKIKVLMKVCAFR